MSVFPRLIITWLAVAGSGRALLRPRLRITLLLVRIGRACGSIATAQQAYHCRQQQTF